MTEKEIYEQALEVIVCYNLLDDDTQEDTEDSYNLAIEFVRKAITELDLYKEMSDIYRRNYQVQMCLNDRLRLIEIEKELGL